MQVITAANHSAQISSRGPAEISWTSPSRSIAVVHTSIHLVAILQYGEGATQRSFSGYISTGCLLTMIITSSWPFKTPFSQNASLFHQIFAFGCLGCLLWHVAFPEAKTYAGAISILTASIWLVTFLHKLFMLCSGTSGIVETIWEGNRAICITVSTERPIRTAPGSYFYIFMPGAFFRYNMRRGFLGVAVQNNLSLRGGPTEIKQAEKEVAAPHTSQNYRGNTSAPAYQDGKAKLMLFTVQDSQSGLSPRKYDRLFLRGPFTQDLYLERYETVILIARGLGIMDVLPLALSLTHRRIHDMKKKQSALSGCDEGPEHRIHGKKKKDSAAPSKGVIPSALFRDLTRKVALFWWIDQYEPNQQLLDHLNDLQLMDSNNNLITVFIISPGAKSSLQNRFVPTPYWELQHNISDTDEVYELIKDKASIHTLSPGQSIIVGSGDKTFTTHIRELAIDLTVKGRTICFAVPKLQGAGVENPIIDSKESKKSMRKRGIKRDPDLENGKN